MDCLGDVSGSKLFVYGFCAGIVLGLAMLVVTLLLVYTKRLGKVDDHSDIQR